MKTFVTIMIFALAILVGGCASTGLTASSHITNVQLTNPNFRVVATNVSGEASSKGVLGVSYGFGIATTQLAIIPLTEDRMLYKNAIKNFWSNFEATHGSVSDRKLALVNVRYDSESLNLFFYTKVTTVVVADVVEFQ
ncbi:MAG TPA: DUF6567 family protein [Cyclobacteriaceae bacterium]|nr:DUF6567 family protein [Cyclobacteriaceae bacterium]